MEINIYNENEFLNIFSENKAKQVSELTIYYNLKNLPSLQNFKKLTRLWMRQSGLRTVTYFPNGLQYLQLNENNISNLPKLPNSLINLEISDNKLITLPNFPEKLKEFDADGNKIVFLSAFSKLLMFFSASNNKLRTIPDLPNSLSCFNVSGNKLTSIPQISGIEDMCCFEIFNNDRLESVQERLTAIVEAKVHNNKYPRWLNYRQLIKINVRW